MRQTYLLVSFPAAVLLIALAGHVTSPSLSASPENSDTSALFAKNCATCHGKDGQAKTFKAKFNHARNLTDPAWQISVSDEQLFNSISNGRGRMPAWGKKLSKEQIDALVAYVRKLRK